MVTKAEIEYVIDYCERRKKEEKRLYIIDRNPFGERIAWARRFPLIEIDRPKEIAAKTSLVYDSTTKQIWEYLNNTWRRIVPKL